MAKYLVYYDSGTSNSRIYLFDEEYNILYTEKKNIGSKDSSIAGTNLVLLEGLKQLYDNMLAASGINEADIQSPIYASGMVTSPYGLTEVPHLLVPLTVQQLAAGMADFFEDKVFHKQFRLVPGLKTLGDDAASINNMRGEEIEIIGAIDKIAEMYPGKKVAVVLPGSHTHVALVEGDKVTAILSNMTGEIYYAISSSTVLSAVLTDNSEPFDTDHLDLDYVKQGMQNIERYGLNRAIYICHAMRLFNKGTVSQRKSYAEGVLMGGFAKGLAYYTEHEWQGCDTAVIVSDEFMHKFYSTVLEKVPALKNIGWLPISKDVSYAVEGLKKIIKSRKDA